MKNYITAAVLAAGMALGAEQAFSATLGLTTEAPSLSSSFAFIDYIEGAANGVLSALGPEVDFTDGVSPTGFTEIIFDIGFPLADPATGATGRIDIFDDDGLFLGGELLAVGFTEDVIEFQFGSLGGSGAGSFGSSVLALIAFANPLGANPFGAFVDGESYWASVTISNVADVAPIPLPASVLLLLGGLGFIGAVGARRRRS